MKVTVSVTLEADDDTPTVVHEVFTLQRGPLAPDTLGLGLDEAKGLLAAVQEAMVDEQVRTELDAQAACPDCGEARRHKDTRKIVVRSLYGTLRLPSPRWWHCACRPHETRTFSPLAALLPERTTPELLYLEAKFSGLAAYGASAKLLAEILPLGRRLHATTLCRQAQAVTQRLDDELGDERFSFIDTCQRDRDALPRPDLPMVVSLDGGYVHSAEQRSRRDGWFEVIAGRSMPADGPSKCFGFVQTYDTKPKRRLFEVLASQGMAANQAVTFITDGGEDIRSLPPYLNAEAEHLLDWFHVTMRLTVMANMAKSLRSRSPDPDLPPAPPVDLAADVARWYPGFTHSSEAPRRSAGRRIAPTLCNALLPNLHGCRHSETPVRPQRPGGCPGKRSQDRRAAHVFQSLWTSNRYDVTGGTTPDSSRSDEEPAGTARCPDWAVGTVSSVTPPPESRGRSCRVAQPMAKAPHAAKISPGPSA
jgi:hypothetical protein